MSTKASTALSNAIADYHDASCIGRGILDLGNVLLKSKGTWFWREFERDEHQRLLETFIEAMKQMDEAAESLCADIKAFEAHVRAEAAKGSASC